MTLQSYTFGKTPAAVYLTDYLNKINKPIVTKRTGKMLTSYRNTLAELERANRDCILSAHNLARVIGSMREAFYVDVGDSLASNLVTNILVGEMKILLRKSQDIRKIEHYQKRILGKPQSQGEIFNQEGTLVAKITEHKTEIPRYTVADLKDKISAESLTEKWKFKMQRRNINFT